MKRFVRWSVLPLVAACMFTLCKPSIALAWAPSLNLSNDADVSQVPDIAVASDGTMHAVWTDATTHKMMYSSRAVGGSWSAPVVVATYANTTLYMGGDIVIAVGPDGTVHILYADDSSGDSEMYHRSKPVGGTWSAPVNVSQAPGIRSEFPGVAVSPDGTVHAAWIESPTNGSCCGETYYASKSPDGSWTTAIDISNSSANEYPTRLGVGPDNSVHVVTAQEDGGPGQQNIYYYTKPAGGSFDSGENLTGTANVGRGLGGVLKTGDGTVHVLYYEDWPGEIMYMNKPACGSWSVPVNLSNDVSSSWGPALEADGCGNLHVSWIDDGDGAQKVLYAARTTDGSWSAGMDITGGATSANEPHLAVAAPRGTTTGTVELVYSNAPSGNPDVYFTEVSITACLPPTTTAVVGGPIVPRAGLGQSYPNPFNPETSIPVVMSRSGHVRIDVYSADGSRVRNIIDENRAAGTFSVRWDGRDDRGNRLASGVYFYSLAIGGKVVAAKKAVLLK
jgi:FlgD Ig-like domain